MEEEVEIVFIDDLEKLPKLKIDRETNHIYSNNGKLVVWDGK